MFIFHRKTVLFMFLLGLITLGGCGGGNGDPQPGQAQLLVGTWLICRGDEAFDQKEVHSFAGNAGTGNAYSYSSTDASCSTTESHDYSDTFTYTTGGTVTTTLAGNSVNATKIDVIFSGGSPFYSIFYVDTSTTPHTLYMGDETADPALDGTTAAKRPVALLENLPRIKQ